MMASFVFPAFVLFGLLLWMFTVFYLTRDEDMDLITKQVISLVMFIVYVFAIPTALYLGLVQ